jgi:hypothetical protein
MYHTNRNFYRDLAEFVWATNLLRKVRLIIQNVGKVPASNVRCELIARPVDDAVAMEVDDFPNKPKQRKSILDVTANIQRNVLVSREPGNVTIDKNPERFRIAIECGDLQPGRPVWSDAFYLGKRVSGDLELAGKIYAENLPAPQEFRLTVSVKVSNIEVTEQNLERLTEGLYS